MEKIKQIILNNYELSSDEIKLLEDILLSNNSNYEKIISVIQSLIEFRLDYDTILGFVAYVQDYDITWKTNDDTKEIYESLRGVILDK